MPLVTGRHGIGLWLLCLPLALCGCLENGDVDAREPADALLRVVSGHEVDLGEVEASTDVRVPSAVAMFEIENPTDEPVEVLRVVRSCGCLEFEPIREIPCGRSQIRIGVRPQAGRELRQSLWFLLANKQKLELVVHCRTRYAPTIEIGIPRWEIPGSILLIPLSFFGESPPPRANATLTLGPGVTACDVDPGAALCWVPVVDADGQATPMWTSLLRIRTNESGVRGGGFISLQTAGVVHWMELPCRGIDHGG
jgi:hypothetical protein